MGAFFLWGAIAAVIVFFTRLYNELHNIGTGRRTSDLPMIAAGVIGVLAALIFSNPVGALGAGIGAVITALAAKFI